MGRNIRVLFQALILAILPVLLYAKGADGLIILMGTIQHAITNADALSFEFTGKLSFSFFTAAPDDPARKRIDLTFDVQRLPIQIPRFSGTEYDREKNPFRVSYKNAVEHALAASRTGETVDVVLIEPKLSYDVNGVLKKIHSARGQILPDHLKREQIPRGMR